MTLTIEELGELATTPPTVKLSWMQRLERVIAYVALATALVAIGFGLFAVVRVGEQQSCTNGILGERQKVSDTPALIEEAAAIAAWSQNVVDLFALPQHPTPAQAKQESGVFLSQTKAEAAALKDAATVLAANKTYRDAHPLGQC